MTKQRRAAARLVLPLALFAALLPPLQLCAQEQEPETTLPACGIRYPGGYDPNTVGVLEGRVTGIDRPEHGPVALHLETASGGYTVLTAPAWYWAERKIAVAAGDQVRAKGSKTMGEDGDLYLVAQEIAVAGSNAPVVLRDASGKPAWSGCGPGGCKRRGR